MGRGEQSGVGVRGGCLELKVGVSQSADGLGPPSPWRTTISHRITINTAPSVLTSASLLALLEGFRKSTQRHSGCTMLHIQSAELSLVLLLLLTGASTGCHSAPSDGDGAKAATQVAAVATSSDAELCERYGRAKAKQLEHSSDYAAKKIDTCLEGLRRLANESPKAADCLRSCYGRSVTLDDFKSCAYCVPK